MRLSSEVYFRNRRWWFAVLELGRLGQTLERLICRPCRNRKDARIQANQALAHERSKRDAA